MELSGFISSNHNGWAMIGGTAFADYMYEFAENNGIASEHDEGLGGREAIIKNCNMVMYTSKEKWNLRKRKRDSLIACSVLTGFMKWSQIIQGIPNGQSPDMI